MVSTLDSGTGAGRQPKDTAGDAIVLATTDASFETKVREACAGLGGELRCWRASLDGADPAQATTMLTESGAQVVALGPDVPVDTALDVTRRIDELHPGVTVVIFAEPSTTLLQSALRAGARDVVAPEASHAELRGALELAREASLRRQVPADDDGAGAEPARRIVSVLCPKGGAGKTTMSSNLAFGLAQRAPGEVVVVDLDLQFGDIASSLRLEPEHTMADTMRARVAVDSAALKTYLTPHPVGLYALCAPHSPTEVDDLTTQHVQMVIQMLAESFRYVVLDTPSGLDEFTLGAIELSTDLVLLSATDVPSVRSTRKEVEALRVIATPNQRWHFVLNRADARTGLHMQAIEASVGLDVDVAIPSSGAVPLSLNQGTPILEADPRSPVAVAISQLVDRLGPAGQVTGSKSGSGTFWRRKSA